MVGSRRPRRTPPRLERRGCILVVRTHHTPRSRTSPPRRPRLRANARVAIKEGPHYTANIALCHRYHQAQGDPVAMRELIAEQTDAVICEKSASSTGG